MSGILQALFASFPSGGPEYSLYMWGRNSQGELGLDNTTDRSSPVQVGALSDWAQISASARGQLTGSIKTDGTLWTWGDGGNGGLGSGSTAGRSSPVQVGALTNWTQVSVGLQFMEAVKTDGTLWAWGNGGSGRTGIGTTASVSSPTQVGALTDWAHVSAGTDHCAAVKTDGTLWTWGRNRVGELGIGSTGYANYKSSPVQVGALTNWYRAGASKGGGNTNATLAVKTDGTLWAWGYKSLLGLGGSTTFSSPVQVGSDTDWAFVQPAGLHTIAGKTTGSIWAWGYNGSGQLGQGDTTNRFTPTQIGALTTWLQGDAGSSNQGNSGAVKTDGTLWMWGNNIDGILGDGTTTSRSSPVQIGALTSWVQVSTGYRHTGALLEV